MARALPVIVDNNLMQEAIPVVSSVAAGFSRLNTRDWRPYTQWKPTGTTNEWIRFDISASPSADTVCISGHDLFSSGATIKLQRSVDAAFTSPIDVVSSTPSDDTTLYLEFSAVSSRWWRILITTATTAPAIGIIVLSTRFTFTRFLSSPFSRLPETIVMETQQGVKGHVLGRRVNFIELLITALWKFYPQNDFALFQAIWDARIHTDPFIWVWDPGDHADEAALVQVVDGARLDGQVTAVTRRLSLSMSGVKGV